MEPKASTKAYQHCYEENVITTFKDVESYLLGSSTLVNNNVDRIERQKQRPVHAFGRKPQVRD